MKDPKLKPTKAFAYTGTKPVKFVRKFEALIETRKRDNMAAFYVTKTSDSGNLIDLVSNGSELGIISLHLHKVSTTEDNKPKNELRMYGHHDASFSYARRRKARVRRIKTTGHDVRNLHVMANYGRK